MYRFFVQPQIDKQTNSIFGYEVLLRENTDGIWKLPKSFTDVSVEEQVGILEETVSDLAQKLHNKVLSFNLNREQFNDPYTLGAIITLKKRIQPVTLAIELTEPPTLSAIQKISTILKQHNISLVLDDVGTGENTYENIRPLLPYVDEIKFAMQNLRMAGVSERIPEYLDFWTKQAEFYRLNVVLEGVESPEDQALAEQFGIVIQQGYFYGKPELVIAND